MAASMCMPLFYPLTGGSAIQWAVINGDKESGVTIMRMSEGLDTGDMIDKW